MIKKIFLTLGILIVLLVLGIVIFLLTFDLNHYRNFVATQASNALGRNVEIGSLSTKLSLIPTIKVNGVRILDNSQKEPVLLVPNLEAVVELTPLLRGQIVVQKISVPQANLVWAGESQSSEKQAKDSSKESATKVSSKDTSKLWIDAITIDELQCRIGKEKPYNFKLSKIALKQLSKFSFDVTYLKNTFSVTGNLGSVLELMTRKEGLPVDLTISQEKAKLKINGKIGDVANLKKMNFQISADVPNLAVFLKKWNIKSTKIPESVLAFKTTFDGDLEKASLRKISLTLGKKELSLEAQGTLNELNKNPTANLTSILSILEGSINKLWGIKPLELATKITADKKAISFSEIQLNIGKSDAHGEIQIQPAQKPIFIQGHLESTYFDIYDLMDISNKTGANETSVSVPKKRFLSTEKLPYEMLKGLEADVKLNIAHLKFSKEITEYASVNTAVELKQGVLDMPMQIALFGGNIQNRLNIQASSKSVSIETKASGIQVNKIKALNKDIQNASAYLTLSLKGVGNSLHDLASTAQGQATIELTEGQIVNKWFNSLPTTLNLLKGRGNTLAFSTQDQKTELVCGALNLPIKNGMAISQNQIALETDTLNFIVNGQIDLKNEMVDLTMIPSVSQTRGMANQLLEISQAIHLVGPWTAVETKVDPIDMLESFAKTAVNKLAGQKQTAISSTALCQKALGRSLIQTKATKVQPKKEQKAIPANSVTKEQPDLKKQLIQSLSQALTNQVTPKKQ